jgi:hypothetical protein
VAFRHWGAAPGQQDFSWGIAAEYLYGGTLDVTEQSSAPVAVGGRGDLVGSKLRNSRPRGAAPGLPHLGGDRVDAEVIDAHDRAFQEAGKFGVWTKADAIVQFDDLTATPQ